MQSRLIYLNQADLYKELGSVEPKSFFAVIDEKLKPRLPRQILESKNVFWLTHPEAQKNISSFSEIAEFFLKSGIDRSSTLIAIGGGATTDLAGFVAATILRGVNWIAVPTTLLAMIDGSLGGKVAINSPSGKNLLGSFHHPEKIFISGEFLSTLDEENWNSGKGEVLKYGFLSSAIHDLIIQKAPVENVARACAEYKMGVVERDFKEKGERIHLNLGHTLGHAFESSLGISHGIAVAMGMKYLFELMGMEKALQHWQEMADALSMPLNQLTVRNYKNYDRKKLEAYLFQDKKKKKESLRIILADGPGRIKTTDIPLTELRTRLDSHAELSR